MGDRHHAAEVGDDVAPAELGPEPQTGVDHAQRVEEVLLHDPADVSTCGIAPAQRLGEEDVVRHRRVVAARSRLDRARDEFAYGGHRIREAVVDPAGARLPHPGHPGRVGQEVEDRRAIPRGARELGHDVGHPVRQREPPELDRPQHEDVDQRLGSGEDAEHRVGGQGPGVGGVAEADRLVEADLPAACQPDDGAVVPPSLHVGPHHRTQPVETLGVETCHHRPPFAIDLSAV